MWGAGHSQHSPEGSQDGRKLIDPGWRQPPVRRLPTQAVPALNVAKRSTIRRPERARPCRIAPTRKDADFGCFKYIHGSRSPGGRQSTHSQRYEAICDFSKEEGCRGRQRTENMVPLSRHAVPRTKTTEGRPAALGMSRGHNQDLGGMMTGYGRGTPPSRQVD